MIVSNKALWDPRLKERKKKGIMETCVNKTYVVSIWLVNEKALWRQVWEDLCLLNNKKAFKTIIEDNMRVNSRMIAWDPR